MKIMFRIIRPIGLAVLAVSWPEAPILAQGVSIPDEGLDAAIRDALHSRPGGSPQSGL